MLCFCFLHRIGVNKLRKLCLLFVFSLILKVIFFFISKIKKEKERNKKKPFAIQQTDRLYGIWSSSVFGNITGAKVGPMEPVLHETEKQK